MLESDVIKGCIKNDRRSQNELYKRYFPLMSSIALRYTQDQEKAVQDMNMGFLKVLQNIKSYNPKLNLSTWIRNILVNHLIDEYRKEKSYIANIHISDFEENDGNVVYNEADEKFETENLRAMLASLPDVTQKVFNLFAIDGYKHKEIANMLNISEGTSKWHVNEARKRLKLQILAQQNQEKKSTNRSQKIG